MEGELRDDQWALIAPLLPPPKQRGRPRADDRRTVNGILWVLRPGARWRGLPREFGSPSTCHAACKNGKTRGYGSISGSPSLVPWTGKASWTGARPFWMAASCRPKKV
jgi:transposase